jgi:hypothetical protein
MNKFGLLVIILTTIAIYFQFYKDEYIKDENKKKKFGLFIFIATVIGLWIGYIIQEYDKKDSIKETKVQNQSMEKTIKAQSDTIRNLLKSYFLEIKSYTINNKKIIVEKIDTFTQVQNIEKNTAIHPINKINQRIIPPEKKKNIKELLASSNKHTILISCILGDSEGCIFAKELQDLFHDAGWNVLCEQKVIVGTAKGIYISVKDKDNFPTHLVYVLKSLEMSGEKFRLQVKENLDKDLIELFIGNNN